MSVLHNRYEPAPTPEEELASDMEFEEFLTLSDEEIDRRVEVEMRRTVEYRATLTPLQLYRSDRRSALASCISRRDTIRRLLDCDLTRDMLRNAQMRLVRLRTTLSAGPQGSTVQ